MQNGLIGAGIALAEVVVGLIVAIEAGQDGRNPPGWTPTAFLIMPFASALQETLARFQAAFSAFVSLAASAGAGMKTMPTSSAAVIVTNDLAAT